MVWLKVTRGAERRGSRAVDFMSIAVLYIGECTCVGFSY